MVIEVQKLTDPKSEWSRTTFESMRDVDLPWDPRPADVPAEGDPPPGFVWAHDANGRPYRRKAEAGARPQS